MTSIKKWPFCKFLAIVLCVWLAAEAHFAFSQQDTPLANFAKARQDYANGDYRLSVGDLEAIVKVVDDSRPENRDFMGHVYLLLGASLEKLGENGRAKNSYAKSAGLLGRGEEPSIEGISLTGLPLLERTFSGQQNPPVPEVPADMETLLAKFNKGRDAYLSGNLEYAQGLMETLLADLESVAGRTVFKGETYLLAGAVYDARGSRSPAIKYFCLAKSILGQGKTIAGVDLARLNYYATECPGAGVAMAGATSVPETTRSRGSSVMGTILKSILISAVVSGLIWYLFFSKNGPFTKKSSGNGGTYSSTCFTTFWEFQVSVEWLGPPGTASFTPDAYPQPNEGNNWEDHVTYTLSVTGGTVGSISLNMDVTIGAGDGKKRQDIVSVDGVQVLNETNTFSDPCSSLAKKKYSGVYTRTSAGTFTVNHKVVLSGAAAIGTSMNVIKKY
jgi:tetratricopeptide (TPR) repeat protein